MKVDDVGAGPGAGSRPIQPSTELQAIVRVEAHELRPDKLRQVNAGVRTPRYLTQLFRSDIQHPDVGRSGGAGYGERNLGSVRRKIESAGKLRGELRPFRHASR